MLKGSRHLEESIKKMSEASKGKHFSLKTEFKKGQKHSEETKRKIGLASLGNKFRLGIKHSEETKRKMSENSSHYNLGKHFSIKSRMKMSKARKGKYTGEENNFWKGGVTPIYNKIRNGIELRLWREAVFARDNFTCQKTNIKGGKLCAHHIQNFSHFPELRLAIDNGITLSLKEHKKFHRKYGIKNNTREQLNEFLIN